jgi:hypothetical protein
LSPLRVKNRVTSRCSIVRLNVRTHV